MARVVTHGALGRRFNGAFNNRRDIGYIMALGEAAIDIARRVTNGLLIFFASYGTMNETLEEWKKTRQWNQLTAVKPVLVEPREKHLFPSIMENYAKMCENESGACLIAVCRGKVRH